MQKKRIYMDIAAATPLDSRVKKAMDPYWDRHFGNAGAIHQEGTVAKKALEEARKNVADVLAARVDEIVFTSGGTESNTLAILGFVAHYEREHEGNLSKLHIVTSVIEHPSVLDGFKDYERKGARVDYVGVDERGIVDIKQLRKVITAETALVSIMYVNNEIGTIQPLHEVSKIIKSVRFSPSGALRGGGPIFHTDAAQAPLWIPVKVDRLGVDLMTLDAQKIYGPKGIGALYIRRGVNLRPIFIKGGKQEHGLRPGTEPLPLIVGFAKALEIAEKERAKTVTRLVKLRDYFIKQILAKIPNTVLNGDPKERIVNNINISLPGFDSEFLIISLDECGIACASRSACLEGGQGSYVVRSIDGSIQSASAVSRATSSLRFSMGRDVTRKDIDYVVKQLVGIVVAKSKK